MVNCAQNSSLVFGFYFQPLPCCVCDFCSVVVAEEKKLPSILDLNLLHFWMRVGFSCPAVGLSNFCWKSFIYCRAFDTNFYLFVHNEPVLRSKANPEFQKALSRTNLLLALRKGFLLADFRTDLV